MSTAEITTSQENEPFSLFKIIATVFSIIFIRIFIENFSSPSGTGYFFSWQGILLHASMYFFSVFLSLALLTRIFTKESFENILTLLTKIFTFILIAPLFDLALDGSIASSMRYVPVNFESIIPFFFKMMNPFSSQGITVGMHISAYLIFISLAIFVYKKTNSLLKSFFFLFASYFLIFLYAIIPGIITMFTADNMPVALTYALILKQSWITTTIENLFSFQDTLWQGDYMHDILMARIFWILIFAQTTIIFFIANPKLRTPLRKNLRIERIVFWFIVAAIGIFTSQKKSGSIDIQNAANIITLIIFFILIALNAWLAIFINDAEDVKIDAISNKNRPLAKKEISAKDWNEIQLMLFIFIVFGLATINKATALLLILAQSAYYIYSARPLRLKKHFIFSSILVGSAAVFISMAGFFLVSPDQHITAFPAKLIFLIGISFAIISNKKDIKDYEGDKKDGMRTMPVVFGQKKANYIIATLYGLIVILMPIILNIYSMLPIAACIALFAFFLFTKKTYEEKYIFLLFFIYMLTLFLVSF
ncbi:MAG: UbiA family prenyltransferase [Candidatus Moranbacteria bacterium]|nr:UbiA family prenyltransferase [Candidatus Moranbacteria bacterium]